MVRKVGNPQGDVLDILINARLGDGGIYQNGVNYYMVFFSKFKDYLEMKREWCRPYIPRDISKAESLLYLDDGSYHQKKHFTNIYCNTFSVKETELQWNGEKPTPLGVGWIAQIRNYVHP